MADHIQELVERVILALPLEYRQAFAGLIRGATQTIHRVMKGMELCMAIL
jgi:hypothetical protein